MNNLYRFYWNCGRMGDVEGIFIATEEEVEAALGKTVYFGEILGKHSEIYGELDRGDLTKLEVSDTTVSELLAVVGKTVSGYNPLEYLQEEDE